MNNNNNNKTSVYLWDQEPVDGTLFLVLSDPSLLVYGRNIIQVILHLSKYK